MTAVITIGVAPAPPSRSVVATSGDSAENAEQFTGALNSALGSDTNDDSAPADPSLLAAQDAASDATDAATAASGELAVASLLAAAVSAVMSTAVPSTGRAASVEALDATSAAGSSWSAVTLSSNQQELPFDATVAALSAATSATPSLTDSLQVSAGGPADPTQSPMAAALTTLPSNLAAKDAPNSTPHHRSVQQQLDLARVRRVDGAIEHHERGEGASCKPGCAIRSRANDPAQPSATSAFASVLGEAEATTPATTSEQRSDRAGHTVTPDADAAAVPFTQAMQPTVTTAPVAATSVATPTHYTMVEQPELASALINLRSRGNGIHELTVQLHPADLGAVNVTAALLGNTLNVTISAADPAARAALSATALPQLQQQLAQAGYNGLDLGLSQSGQQSYAGQQGYAGNQNGDGGRHRVNYRGGLSSPNATAIAATRAQRPLVATNEGVDRWL